MWECYDMLCSISVLLALISIFLTKITHDPCFISSKPTSSKKRTRLKNVICLYYLLAYKFIKIFFYHSKFCLSLVLPILKWLLPTAKLKLLLLHSKLVLENFLNSLNLALQSYKSWVSLWASLSSVSSNLHRFKWAFTQLIFSGVE